MEASQPSILRRFPRRLAATSLLVFTAVGCGGETKPLQIPVAGKVTIDGKPATEGGVSYRDAASGMIQPAGKIQPDGTYSLTHDRREGAPPGKYRVIVFVTESPKTDPGGNAGLPRVVVNKRFTDPATTPLLVEVKEGASAGQYDLAVTR
ncbi:MAG: hypothetical protein H0T51_01215 [Pirellulales bacterium]|nr:hypothetical protein [Pirellulales bacterium]